KGVTGAGAWGGRNHAGAMVTGQARPAPPAGAGWAATAAATASAPTETATPTRTRRPRRTRRDGSSDPIGMGGHLPRRVVRRGHASIRAREGQGYGGDGCEMIGPAG